MVSRMHSARISHSTCSPAPMRMTRTYKTLMFANPFWQISCCFSLLSVVWQVPANICRNRKWCAPNALTVSCWFPHFVYSIQRYGFVVVAFFINWCWCCCYNSIRMFTERWRSGGEKHIVLSDRFDSNWWGYRRTETLKHTKPHHRSNHSMQFSVFIAFSLTWSALIFGCPIHRSHFLVSFGRLAVWWWFLVKWLAIFGEINRLIVFIYRRKNWINIKYILLEIFTKNLFKKKTKNWINWIAWNSWKIK